MWRRIADAIPWILAIPAGVALAEDWQPWATIIGVVTFLAWVALIGAFVSRRRRGQLLRRETNDLRPSEGTGELGEDR